jgi:hypothetical protein
MKIRSFSFGLILLACFSVQAQPSELEDTFPQQLTARDLLQACASSYLTARGRGLRKYCSGFVSGVEESVRLLSHSGSVAPGVGSCVPKGKTASHFVDVFVKFASGPAVDLQQPAARVVMAALAAAFPCPRPATAD